MNDINKSVSAFNISNAQLNTSSDFDNQRFYRKKYRLALKLYATLDIQAYAKTQPNWAAKDVLAAIVKDYDPQLPSNILLEMTQFILEEWEKNQMTKQDFVPA